MTFKKLCITCYTILTLTSCVRAQTWQDNYSLTHTFAGGGTDVTNTLTWMLANNTAGGLTWIWPASNGASGQAIVTNGSGILNWGGPYLTSAVTTFSAGATGLTPNSATSGAVTLAGTLVLASGGTGLSSYATGDIPYYNPGLSTTAFSKISYGPAYLPLIGDGAGTYAFAYLDLAQAVTGTLPVANGGMGLASLTAHRTLVGAGTSSPALIAPGVAGTVYVSNGTSSDPSFQSPSTFLATTFSGGTTGLTPNSPTVGGIVLAGTLVNANGGTGFSTYTTGDILYASASNVLSKRAIGSTGDVLTVSGGVPTWAAASAAGFILNQYTAQTSAGFNVTAGAPAKTTSFTEATILNDATSSTAFIAKAGLRISSSGAWTGAGTLNAGLIFNINTSGATTDYDIQGTGNNWDVDVSGNASLLSLALSNSLTEANGGTNQSTYTTGDMLYASATNTLSKLAATTNGYVLSLAGGIPAWVANTAVTNPMATTGDIIYSSNNSGTPARLGVGLTNHPLIVTGGVPAWNTKMILSGGNISVEQNASGTVGTTASISGGTGVAAAGGNGALAAGGGGVGFKGGAVSITAGTSGTGTNLSGGSITLSLGLGTGTGTSVTNFQLSGPIQGTSGTTAQTLASYMQIVAQHNPSGFPTDDFVEFNLGGGSITPSISMKNSTNGNFLAILPSAPSSSRFYTLRDPGANADFLFETSDLSATGSIATTTTTRGKLGSVAIGSTGQRLTVAGGVPTWANQYVSTGAATLVAGTVLIADANVTATSVIHASATTFVNPGAYFISAIVAGVSFTVTSTNVLDASTIGYVILK